MAPPIELEYGVYWNDGTDDGFTNSNESLPVVVRAGKKRKRTLKIDRVTLELEVRCDKRNRGGDMSAVWTEVEVGSTVLLNKLLDGRTKKWHQSVSIAPGSSSKSVLTEKGLPKLGYRVSHVGEVVESIEKDLGKVAH